MEHKDPLIIGGREFHSRFILGSGKYSLSLIEAAVREGGRGLTEAQRETFYRALETIADNLDRICAAEETR